MTDYTIHKGSMYHHNPIGKSVRNFAKELTSDVDSGQKGAAHIQNDQLFIYLLTDFGR